MGASEEENMFTTLLVVVGALFVAVLAGTVLDPRPASAIPDADDRESDDALVMEAIVLSRF